MSYKDERSNPNASNYSNTGSTAANPRAPQHNPKDPNLPREPTGPIASDSLAADSLSSGGAFANNENAHRMDVKGSSSTFNTTDTSNAAELPPAPDAARRDGDDKVKYPEGAGKPSFHGVHDEHGYVGGPSRRDREAQKSTGSGEYATGQARSSTGHSSGEQYRTHAVADPAPTAFGHFQREGDLKPKGKNITEDDNMPSSDDNSNTTTVPGDVGGPQDPGRLAERKMFSRDADTSAGGNAGGNAGGPRQYDIERSTGEFDVLNSEASTHPGD